MRSGAPRAWNALSVQELTSESHLLIGRRRLEDIRHHCTPNKILPRMNQHPETITCNPTSALSKAAGRRLGNRRSGPICTALLIGFGFIQQSHAGVFTLDFEGASGGTDVADTYAGLGIHFGGAVFATAGIDLNETDFPPFSGVNVVLPNDSGLIRASLDKPATSISAYFTYALDPGVHLYLTAYATPDFTGPALFSKQSLFSENYAGSGHAPNEWIGVGRILPQIRSFEISGGGIPGGFTMDNLTVVPEPNMTWAVGAVLLGVALRRFRQTT